MKFNALYIRIPEGHWRGWREMDRQAGTKTKRRGKANRGLQAGSFIRAINGHIETPQFPRPLFYQHHFRSQTCRIF